MLIAHNNPSCPLVENITKADSFIAQVLNNYDEALGNRILEEELLTQMDLGARGLLLASYRDAFAMALRLCAVKPDDVLFYPLNGKLEGADLASATGMKIFLVDIDSTTRGISPEGIASILSEIKGKYLNSRKVVVIEHTDGVQANYESFRSLVEEENLIVIENGTELQSTSSKAIRSSLGGYLILPIGEYADGIGRSGVVLVCPSEERYIKGKELLARLAKSNLYDALGTRMNRNSLCSTMQLIRGYIERQSLSEKSEKRFQIASAYRNGLEPILGVYMHHYPTLREGIGTPLRCILSVDRTLVNFSKDELIIKLQEQEIEALPIAKPLNQIPKYSRLISYRNGLSEAWYERSLLLPSGSGMPLEKVDQIVKLIYNIVQHFN